MGGAPARGLDADADADRRRRAKARGFFVDLTGAQGLRRRDKPSVGGRVLLSRCRARCTRASSSGCAGCRSRTTTCRKPGDLPAARAAAAADAARVAVRPRCDRACAARARAFAAEGEVRVVVGLPALTRAIAEIDRLPDAGAHAGRVGELRRSHADRESGANPESVARRIRGTIWRIDRPQRHRLPADRAVEGGAGAPGRAHRDQGRRPVDARRRAAHAAPAGRRGDRRRRGHRAGGSCACSCAAGSTPADDGARATPTGRSSASICPRTRTTARSAQRSLIGPDDKFSTGGMVELDTGNARYLIRFTQTLERQAGWSWALFNAVRKLSA